MNQQGQKNGKGKKKPVKKQSVKNLPLSKLENEIDDLLIHATRVLHKIFVAKYGDEQQRDLQPSYAKALESFKRTMHKMGKFWLQYVSERETTAEWKARTAKAAKPVKAKPKPPTPPVKPKPIPKPAPAPEPDEQEETEAFHEPEPQSPGERIEKYFE